MGHKCPDVIPGTACGTQTALKTEPERIATGIFDHIDGFFERSYNVQSNAS
jgi:hypothetical protein